MNRTTIALCACFLTLISLSVKAETNLSVACKSKGDLNDSFDLKFKSEKLIRIIARVDWKNIPKEMVIQADEIIESTEDRGIAESNVNYKIDLNKHSTEPHPAGIFTLQLTRSPIHFGERRNFLESIIGIDSYHYGKMIEKISYELPGTTYSQSFSAEMTCNP